MASCDWQKIKGSGEAKAMFRHCDAEERLKTEHQNTDIDKTRTHLNMNFGLFTDGYADICNAYDNRIAELDKNPNANKRKDRVTLIGLSIPAPEGMDDATSRKWFGDVYELLSDTYGEELLGGTVHYDEIHEYTDPETKEQRMSRPAMHAYMIPAKDGKLNAKQVMSRRNMVFLNNAVESLTEEGYPGYKFQTGTKRKSRKTMEELKRASDEAAVVVEAERKAAEIIKDAHTTADAYMIEQRKLIKQERATAKEDAEKHAEDVLRAAREEVREKDVEAEKRLKTANTTLQSVQQKEKQLDDKLNEVEQVRMRLQNVYDDAKGIAAGFAEDQFYREFRDSLKGSMSGIRMKSGHTAWDSWSKYVDDALNTAKNEMHNRNLTPQQQFKTRVEDRGAQANATFSTVMAELQKTEKTDDLQY